MAGLYRQDRKDYAEAEGVGMTMRGVWVQILITFGGIGLAIGLLSLELLTDWGYWVVGISSIVIGWMARHSIEKGLG